MIYYLLIENYENWFAQCKNMKAIQKMLYSKICCITGFYLAHFSIIKDLKDKNDKLVLFAIPIVINIMINLFS